MVAGCTGNTPGGLSETDVETFGLIAAGQLSAGDREESVARLVAWGAVVLDGQQKNRPIALNPNDVARRRMEEELRLAAERVRKMMAMPQVTDELAQQWERAQSRAGAGSEYIDDAEVVNARLDYLVRSAETEILSAQPGPRTRLLMNRCATRDQEALDRGVRMRTLYLATVRDAGVAAEYARTMTCHGAEYRTLPEPFERCIIVDRRAALVSNHLVEGAPAHSAWLITDRAMVAYIAAEYEEKWRRADPWRGELQASAEWSVDTVSGAQGIRTTRRQREIMRDACAGIDQKATARRLGISLRTVSNEINDLKDRFQAESPMQLAALWTLSPDRLVDDSGPEDGLTAA